MSWSTYLPILALFSLALIRYWKKTYTRLPPGPPRAFAFGNALQLQISHSWLYYRDLANKYGSSFLFTDGYVMYQFDSVNLLVGDVLSLMVFGQPIIILSSLQAAEDILVKRSASFSGRPNLSMCGDLFVQNLPFEDYLYR